MSEMGGPMEDLIAKGPISKYSQGVPTATQGPIPEILKNYMDVSFGGGRGVSLGLGERVDYEHSCRQGLALRTGSVSQRGFC